MGICASDTSSVHVESYGNEDAVVHYTEISIETNRSSTRIGSTNYSHPGSKGFNQDSSILFQGYGIEDGVLCGVFDGHGENGNIVSKMVRNRLPSLLLDQRNALAKISASPSKNFLKWKDACFSSFKIMNYEIKLLENLDCSCSGTTAVVVTKQGNDLVIANLGDSRAVLGTRTENGIMAIQLTTDLKPGVASEAERIRKCKGRVLALEKEPHILRVWLPLRDSPGLAMSRAFGDFVLKKHGIIAIPDVSYRHLSPNDHFLVLASDGVWDVLSNDQEGSAAKAIVDAAISSWEHKFPNSNRDDCTAICLFFQH
ncbi:hypothetical protein RD792_001708 [Penstemon davidsonii]|uniref:PPM-type phosphatase domain-containing protein n=1 Tax=Penstemon davidsonii TaxID=160366 RepID=A0ABR0DPF7_9LAMI|nr:hypothetical protein RD792_001708 [Penstemon davidsonii]